jgi:hypothetical protein
MLLAFTSVCPEREKLMNEEVGRMGADGKLICAYKFRVHLTLLTRLSYLPCLSAPAKLDLPIQVYFVFFIST